MPAQNYIHTGPQVLRLLVRLPAFILLAILAPVLRFLVGLLALLGVLTALFWKLVGPPHFPFVPLLAASIGCGLALVGYEALLRLPKPVTVRASGLPGPSDLSYHALSAHHLAIGHYRPEH
jgi:hypothetical protein